MKLPFTTPAKWREQHSYGTDCYFCLTNTLGYSTKNKTLIKYPDVKSVDLPSCSNQMPGDNVPLTSSSSVHPEENERQPQLNDLNRVLNLPKWKSEILGSRLKELNCLAPGVHTTSYRHRDENFHQFFYDEPTLCYCSDGWFDGDFGNKTSARRMASF